MELNKASEEFAIKHVVRSLVEMTDDEKLERWTNGERAKEQADEIVSSIVAEALQALEQKEQDDAG